ncbi:MAG: DUF3820 family protein [Bacteroidales bacterium]|nr:DUF3820 family protein [Bacteroidales bacterium]
MNEDLQVPFERNILIEIVSTPMPFGKYKGSVVANLPMHYLEWFKRQGFPKGKLGIMLETVYEIKLNGLDEILISLKKIN